MTAPTIGLGRISLPYTVSGLTHVVRMYVKNPTFSGGIWNIDIHPDTGGVANWTAAAQGFADHVSSAMATGTTAGTCVLEELATTGWQPRDTATVTLPNLAGSAVLAGQVTLTLRALNFKRPKIVIMEGNPVAPTKFTSPTGGAGGLDAFIDGFLGSSLTAQRPWFFMADMHESFLNVSSFVSVTTTYNRKLRRARGLA